MKALLVAALMVGAGCVTAQGGRSESGNGGIATATGNTINVNPRANVNSPNSNSAEPASNGTPANK